MAFTYTGALTSDLEKVRRLISDTDSANVLFTDAEIDFFLAEGGSLYRAAALAARAIASSKALLAQSITEGDFTENLGAMSANWLALAKGWEAKAAQKIGTGAVTRIDGYSQTVRSDAT